MQPIQMFANSAWISPLNEILSVDARIHPEDEYSSTIRKAIEGSVPAGRADSTSACEDLPSRREAPARVGCLLVCPRSLMTSSLNAEPRHRTSGYDSLYVLLCTVIQMVAASIWTSTFVGIASLEPQVLTLRSVSLPERNVLNPLQRDGRRRRPLCLEPLQHPVTFNSVLRPRCCSNELDL